MASGHCHSFVTFFLCFQYTLYIISEASFVRFALGEWGKGGVCQLQPQIVFGSGCKLYVYIIMIRERLEDDV